MKSQKEEFIAYLEKKLPDFATPQDLVDLNIVGSRTTLIADRKSGKGIPFVQLTPRRVRYPKHVVIKYLVEKFKETK